MRPLKPPNGHSFLPSSRVRSEWPHQVIRDEINIGHGNEGPAGRRSVNRLPRPP